MKNSPCRQQRPIYPHLKGAMLSSVLPTALLFLFSAPVFAHKEAASSFTARTNGDVIDFDFRVNGTSAVEVVSRAHPDIPAPEKNALKPFRELLLKYIAEHVLVANNGKRCVHKDASYFQYAEALDRLVVKLPVRCNGPLDILTIDAFLFFEEETTHTTISTFYHKRAKEHYVFAGRKTAIIHVNRLFQLPERKYSREGYRGVPSGMPANLNDTSTGDGENPINSAPPPTPMFLLAAGALAFILAGFPLLFLLAVSVAPLSIPQRVLYIGLFGMTSLLSLALGAADMLGFNTSLAIILCTASVCFVSFENYLNRKRLASPMVIAIAGLFHGVLYHAAASSIILEQYTSLKNLTLFASGLATSLLVLGATISAAAIILHRRHGKIMPRLTKVFSIALSIIAAGWAVVAIL